MNINLYFSVSILLNLKYVLTTHYNEKYELELYLVNVINHIIYYNQFQEKLSLWNNISMVEDSAMSLNTFINQNIKESYFRHPIFRSIVSLINYRYANYLKIYDGHIKTMISECENYYNKKLFDNYIECSKLIQDVVCNSNGMFNTLYEILVFIKNLVVETLSSRYEVPITIINEIYNVFTYTLLKTKSYTNIKLNDFGIDDACKDLLNFKRFHAKITDMLNNLSYFDKTGNITSNLVHNCLLEKYEKLVLQKENDKSFVHFIYDCLIVFYKETIKNEKDNLGFQELLHPIVPGLVPPLKVETTEHKIIALNKLLSKQNFEPFKNIKIILENFEKIDASILFQNEVNSENLSQIEKYFEQFLRCRYIEIIKNYNIILTTIINSFRDSKLIGTNNQPEKCINQLRLSVSLSINMLKSLLSAMAILKKICIWEYNIKASNCLKKLASHIKDYVYDLKALNICSSESTKTMNEVKAKTYLDQLSKFHEKFKKGLRYEVPLNAKYQCEFSKTFVHPIKLKRLFMKSKKSSTKCKHSVSEHICIYMNTFCEKIINTEYEFLGFRELIL